MQPPVPHQHVRIAGRTVQVRRVCVEPDDRGGQLGVRLLRDRVEHHRSGQVVEREIEPGTGLDQMLDFRIRLGAGEVRIEVDENDLRHRQAQRAADLSCHHLGDERLGSLARAAELEHVQPVVVGLDDRRERAPFAQRSNVPGGGDGPQAHRCVKCSPTSMPRTGERGAGAAAPARRTRNPFTSDDTKPPLHDTSERRSASKLSACK